MKNSKKSNQKSSDVGYDDNGNIANAPMEDQDFMRIQNLVQLAKKNDISELTFEYQDYKLTIKRNLSVYTPTIDYNNSIPAPAIVAKQPTTVTKETHISVNNPELPSSVDSEISKDLHVIKCPIPGTFYRRPSPDKPPFVEVGSTVKTGNTLCIVEAMKLFNNIESDIDGKVVEILVEDGSPVEFDQPLFTLSKS